MSVTKRRAKFWLHLTTAYLSRYKLRLTLLALIISATVILTIKLLPQIARSNVVTIGYVGTYTIENIPAEVLTIATDPLVGMDENGRPTPSLASYWNVSPDGKIYVVFLKDNLKWHDGTSVDAQNIAIAISDVKVSAVNNKTLEFKLPNPISSFPQALNKPIFKAQSFYGTGQFRIVKIDEVDNIVKRIVLHPKGAGLPRVEIKFYPSEEQLANAVKIGEVKSAHLITAQKIQNWPNLSVDKKRDNLQIATVFLNNEDKLLASREIRQALNFAIDRAVFEGEAALGPIPQSSWAFNSNIKKYDYNVQKAKELVSKSAAKDLEITLSTTPELTEVAYKIKDFWGAVGINVEVKEEKTVPATFQALLAYSKVSPDPDQYALWHSTQKSTNVTHYKNVKIDKLLEDARATTDEGKRKEFYFDFQRFLEEDSPAIFLYHPYKYKITYKNAQDLLSKLPSH